MKTCAAFEDCTRPAMWEVIGWPDDGQRTVMCSFHAEVFMPEDLVELLHGPPATRLESTR